MKNTAANEKGFILFYTLIVVGIISMIAETCFIVTATDLKTAKRSADSIRAYYVADAGLANAFMQLRTPGVAPGAFNVPSTNYQVGATAADSGSYSATVTTSGGTFPVYTIAATGTYQNVSKILTLKVQTASVSRYGYLSNTEIDPVWGGNWYITGMISTGPTHTNGQFNMYGNPVFAGAVSQVAPTVNLWGGPSFSAPDYQEGLTVNAPATSLPNTAAFLNSISTAAQTSQGLYLTGDSTITFVQDGTINVTNAVNGWTDHNIPVPANNALFVHGGTTTVQGVLKGNLTIGSDNEIFIAGNIVYKTDPRVDPTSTDMLGLVAQQNITVTSQGPFNIEIDAFMVALQGQFLVQNFWTFVKGDMDQFGGLSSNLPGGLTGLFDPGTGQVVFGYNQLQYFDERMKTQVPAWFPPVTDAAGRIDYFRLSISEA